MTIGMGKSIVGESRRGTLVSLFGNIFELQYYEPNQIGFVKHVAINGFYK